MSYEVRGMKLQPAWLSIEELEAMQVAIDMADHLAFFVGRDPNADDGYANIADLREWIADYQRARQHLRSLGYPIETSIYHRSHDFIPDGAVDWLKTLPITATDRKIIDWMLFETMDLRAIAEERKARWQEFSDWLKTLEGK